MKKIILVKSSLREARFNPRDVTLREIMSHQCNYSLIVVSVSGIPKPHHVLTPTSSYSSCDIQLRSPNIMTLSSIGNQQSLDKSDIPVHHVCIMNIVEMWVSLPSVLKITWIFFSLIFGGHQSFLWGHWYHFSWRLPWVSKPGLKIT